MLIKVCGIKEQDNLDLLNVQHLDMIGLNFYEPSKRFLASDIHLSIPKGIQKTGVFVQHSLEYILEKSKQYDLDFAQLHGGESVEFCKEVQAHIPVIKVFSIDENFDWTICDEFSFCDYLLFDTKCIGFGGSGVKFNWSILEGYQGEKDFLLSGGISPDDAEKILKIEHPRFLGIDINSKFEDAPGVKNPELVNEFCERIKKENPS